MKSLLSILAGLFFFVGCASVGAVIEGGKEFTTGVVDGSVKAVSTISGAVLEDASNIVETTAEVTQGVVDTVAKEVDEQTDELQDTPKKD
jgi:hypothetical protein